MSVNPPQKKSFMDAFILGIIGISVAVIIVGIAVVFYSDELAEEGLFGQGELDFVDFETLAIEPNNEHYLACPEEFCDFSEADAVSQVYPVQVIELRNRLTRFVDRRDEITLKKMDLASLDFIFLVYTGAEPFPDVVYVKLYDLGGPRSSAAIYSTTIKGTNETGRHRQRVQTWLSVLEQP